VKNLINNIKKHIDVGPILESELMANFKFITIRKGELVVREGQYNVELFYVASGILRCYNLKDGKDVTNDFFFEDTFFTDYGALLNNRPASQYFEAIEDAGLYKISRDRLIELSGKYPELKTWGGKMAEQLFAQSIAKQSKLKADSPKERYLSILDDTPQIIQRIPLSLIASYLGITPVHLSRIRKDLRE